MVTLDTSVNSLGREVECEGGLRKRLDVKIAGRSFLSLGRRVARVKIELEAVLLKPSRVIFVCAGAC